MTDSHPELNGHRPEPAEAELIADAIAVRLGPMMAQFGQAMPQILNMLPAMIAQGVQQALGRRWCQPCLTNRLGWEAAHTQDMASALETAMAAAGVSDPADPRCGQLDLTAFLSSHLRAGSGHIEAMPQVNDWVTIAAGNAVCPAHVPGAPAQQSRRPLLIPPPGMPVSMAAALAGQPG